MHIPNPHTIPLSLYIHFPWCIKKCPYCDFNSHTLNGPLPEKEYVAKLCEDLIALLPYIHHRPIKSIFMGGGTPSLFSATSLSELFDTIHQHCKLSDNIEITLEANPSTVEQERFKAYRALGINRISLGVQSFNDKALGRLGRVHNGDEAQSAIHAIKSAQFEQFNLDLMFGLPEQTIPEALHDLNTALSYAPPHLSWYELTLEPNTPFAHRPPPLPHSDTLWDMQVAGQRLLASAGLLPYEVSAYTQHTPCQHNLNYWEFGDYLAIGAGAHGKLTLNHQEIVRFQQVKHPKQYMTRLPSARQTRVQLDPRELPFEYFLNTLRLRDGTPTAQFQERTGLTLPPLMTTLKHLQHKGWLAPIDSHIKTTPLGFRFLNDVTSTFLSL